MDDLLIEDDLTLVLDRQIAVAPETLWRCWTDAELLKLWFAPKPVETIEAAVDPVAGGIFRAVMQMPGHDPMDGPSGCVLVAQYAKRFVWTSALGPNFRPNPPFDSADDFVLTADIRFLPNEGGTRYIVRALHGLAAHKSAHEKMGFQSGWGTTTDQLTKLAKTLLPS